MYIILLLCNIIVLQIAAVSSNSALQGVCSCDFTHSVSCLYLRYIAGQGTEVTRACDHCCRRVQTLKSDCMMT